MAAQAAPPVENTPVAFGIEFDEPFLLNRFNHLKNREIKSTQILNQLGIRHGFNYLCNNVALLLCFSGGHHLSTLDTRVS
jgi:hypothetical protein